MGGISLRSKSQRLVNPKKMGERGKIVLFATSILGGSGMVLYTLFFSSNSFIQNSYRQNLVRPLSPEHPTLQAEQRFFRALPARPFGMVSCFALQPSLHPLLLCFCCRLLPLSPRSIALMCPVRDFGDTNVSPTFSHPHLRHRVLLEALLPSSPNRFGLRSVPPLV